MKKLVSLFIGLFVVLSIAGCGTSNSSSKESYLGNWKVDKQLENSPLGNYNDGDLKKIIGATLSFTKENASCFGDEMSTLGTTVKNPEYIKMEIPKATFQQTTGTAFDQIGAKGDKITQISVVKDQDRNTGIVFYIVNKDTLLANSVGTFFLLTKIK